MVLPAPNLDDRHFQDLVDDAKRLVQQRCPEWTDHNVSDPGVTLIEAFAQMVDQLIYRLNRVPDRNYVKFLDLIGVELRPPAAARGDGDVLAVRAAAADRAWCAAETEVATPRTDIDEPVVFTTVTDLAIVPCSFDRAGAIVGVGGEPVDHTSALRAGGGFACFSADAAARRRAADRAVERGAVLRGAAPAGLPGRRRRRRPARPAAGLGGVDRRRLGAVRASTGTRPAA